jgi:hypothetical protein
MIRRYIPSTTLLLNVGVVLVAAFVATTSATPAQLAPMPAAVSGARTIEEIQLQSTARFRLGVGHGYELAAGSRWRAVGSLTQGTVYRPLNLAFMIEGKRAELAYPVVKSGRLQGFFLPDHSQFSPVMSAVPLAVQKPAA